MDIYNRCIDTYHICSISSLHFPLLATLHLCVCPPCFAVGQDAVAICVHLFYDFLIALLARHCDTTYIFAIEHGHRNSEFSDSNW